MKDNPTCISTKKNKLKPMTTNTIVSMSRGLPKESPQWVLSKTDIDAITYVDSIFSGNTPDAGKLMNLTTRWPDPPEIDPRWLEKVSHLCRIIVAYKKLAHNYKVQAKQNLYKS